MSYWKFIFKSEIIPGWNLVSLKLFHSRLKFRFFRVRFRVYGSSKKDKETDETHSILPRFHLAWTFRFNLGYILVSDLGL